MKKVLFISLLLSIFALAFSIVMSVSYPLELDSATGQTEHTAVSSSPTVSTQMETERVYDDDAVSVRISVEGSVMTLTMTQYLVGVVAAEMPAVFNMEALKAQAVASRTETLYHIRSTTSVNHPNADVCTDSSCCQAYQDESALRDKWGDAYSTYIAMFLDAVHATDGVYLSYNEEPIQAVFHSSSAGQTAASGEVWQNDLPYLVSVKSPETADTVPNYVSTVTVSLADFKDTVLKYYPDAAFPKDHSKWISGMTYTDSGRIDALTLGGVPVTGPVLRSMFGLRSTAAAIDVDDKNVVFTTTGYGHGVGMSQYGANTLAAEGKNYEEILAWYYTGVTFAAEKDLTNK